MMDGRFRLHSKVELMRTKLDYLGTVRYRYLRSCSFLLPVRTGFELLNLPAFSPSESSCLDCGQPSAAEYLEVRG